MLCLFFFAFCYGHMRWLAPHVLMTLLCTARRCEQKFWREHFEQLCVLLSLGSNDDDGGIDHHKTALFIIPAVA